MNVHPDDRHDPLMPQESYRGPEPRHETWSWPMAVAWIAFLLFLSFVIWVVWG